MLVYCKYVVRTYKMYRLLYALLQVFAILWEYHSPGIYCRTTSETFIFLFYPNEFLINYQKNDSCLAHLHYFIASYSTVLISNLTIVFLAMSVIYYKVFYRIRYMILTKGLGGVMNFKYYFVHENFPGDTEHAPIFGGTWAKILEGQKRAKRRVLLFFSIYIISGITSKGARFPCLLLLLSQYCIMPVLIA